jgi:hypothetical protein
MKRKSLEIHNRVTTDQMRIRAGDPVVLTDDFGKEHVTRAATEPWKAGGHTWLIGVEGRSGGYALCRIRPLTGAEVGGGR